MITYSAVQGTAPTADEKKGLFSAPVCTAFTGSTCTASAVQVANIDPLAAAYIKDIFAQVPDAPATHLINLALRNTVNFTEEIFKFDHHFNDKWHMAVRWVNDSIPTVEPRGLFQAVALPNVATTTTNSPGKGFNFR